MTSAYKFMILQCSKNIATIYIPWIFPYLPFQIDECHEVACIYIYIYSVRCR